MKRARFWMGVALTLTLPVACKEERAERVAASYSSVTKPSISGPASVAVPGAPHVRDKIVVGLESIPVEESYEERAASTITPANLQVKVTELESELGR